MVDQKHVDSLIERLEQETPTSGLVSGSKFLYPKPSGWHQMALEGIALVEALLSISKVRPQLSDYTATVNDFFIPVDASSGNVTITVPLVANNPGRQYVIAKVDSSSNRVRIAASGSDTINGSAYKDLVTQYRSVWLDNDGVTTWFTPSEYLGPNAFLHGNMVYVDGDYGNDSTGVREDFTRPFKTIAAALAAATSGDCVYVYPGTYSITTGLVIPTGISLRGATAINCIISMTGITADKTVVTMGENSRFEDFTIVVGSNGHYTITGIKFGGTTTATARCRTINVSIDNSGAGAGTSNVTGILIQSTGAPGAEFNCVRSCVVTVHSVSSGVKRGLLMDTSAGNAYVRDSNFVAHGGSDAIAIEINKSGAILGMVTGVADGDIADVSQTDGTLQLGQIDLIHSNANGKGFTATQISFNTTWADPGGIPSGTRYYRPGSASVTLTEIKFAVPRKCVIKKLQVRLITAPGTGKSVVWTVRKNGVDTGLTVTISGTSVLGGNDTVSVSFAANDDLSLKVVADAGNSASDSVCEVELY